MPCSRRPEACPERKLHLNRIYLLIGPLCVEQGRFLASFPGSASSVSSNVVYACLIAVRIPPDRKTESADWRFGGMCGSRSASGGWRAGLGGVPSVRGAQLVRRGEGTTFEGLVI